MNILNHKKIANEMVKNFYAKKEPIFITTQKDFKIAMVCPVNIK